MRTRLRTLRRAAIPLHGLLALLVLAAAPALAASPPSVEAGPDRATPGVPFGPTHQLTLQGNVSDDGLPAPPALTSLWTVDSGPGAVQFADASSDQTVATFSANGRYVLRLTASDGDSAVFDTMTVEVNRPSGATASNAMPADGATGQSPDLTLELACDPAQTFAAEFVVAADADFETVLYQSGATPNDVCGHVVRGGLIGPRHYFWSGRIENEAGLWSAWSTPTEFETVHPIRVLELSFRNGEAGYSGAFDADIRGDFNDPTRAVRNWNQGAQDVLRTGSRPLGQSTEEVYRSLLQFASLNSVDSDAILNAWIELTGYEHNGEPAAFIAPNSMYRVLIPWGEGDGLTREGPEPGEASWISSTHPTRWTVPGADGAGSDRSSTPIARSAVTSGEIGNKSFWSSSTLVDTVRDWVANPSSNHGMLLKADDELFRETLNLASREHVNPTFRPRLIIQSLLPAACENGVDDDGDGDTDADDSGCREASDLSETSDCGDGIDNDGDGLVDYPADDQCNGANDPDEGSGSGGSGVCTPGGTRACGTSDVGVCQLGLETCDASSNWGACVGAIAPAAEVCGDGLDQDCDGQDSVCSACSDGETRACGIATGACEEGTESCDGGSWSGVCSGGTGPAPEVCENGIDEDCDGQDTTCTDPEPGSELAAEYRFDLDTSVGETPTFVYDWSGQGNFASVSGAVPTPDGALGGAFAYDGGDDYIAVASASTLDFSAMAGATISIWARPGALNAPDEQTLYGHWNAAKSKRPFQLILQPDNHWLCRTNHKDGSAASVTAAVLGDWTHLACVWTPAGLTLYVNGVAEATDTAVQATLDASPSLHAIGAREKGGVFSQHFQGSLDELAIFSRALDSNEVAERAAAMSIGTACTPGDVRACGSSDIGACQLGSETCDSEGAWGACTGAVEPMPETCGDGVDQDCNGGDLGCECTGNEVDSCYSGPAGTAGVGICSGGSRSCSEGFWGTCSGEITPQVEICGDGIDQDCDGQDSVCSACTDGETRSCGSAVGQCAPGIETCNGGQWSGSCEGGVGPTPETCGDGVDQDCDGGDTACTGGSPDQHLEYRFDADASVVEDWSGEDNDGVAVGTVFTSAGRIGGAFDYDGSAHVVLADTPSLDFQAMSEATVALWARPSALNGASDRTLYGHWNDARSQRSFQVLLLPDNRWECRTNHSDGSAASATTAALGQWTHIACVWTPDGLTIYLGGVAETTDPSVQSTLDANSGPHTIGAREKDGDLSQHFEGTIDEFGIWSRALSPSELQSLMQGVTSP